MFFVHEMEERIPLHPSYFSSEAPDSIRELLYKRKEGTNTGTMMIVRIIGILEISEPKVAPGTGMALYTISYRAVVWQPFRGEVVDGEVSQVVNNGFFVDVGALSVFVSKAVSLCDLKGWRVRYWRSREADWFGADDSEPAQVLYGGRDAFFRRQRGPDRRGWVAGAVAHQGYPFRVEPDVCYRQHP